MSFSSKVKTQVFPWQLSRTFVIMKGGEACHSQREHLSNRHAHFKNDIPTEKASVCVFQPRIISVFIFSLKNKR